MRKTNERVIKIMQLMAEHNFIGFDEILCYLSQTKIKRDSAERQAIRYLKLMKNYNWVSTFLTPFRKEQKVHYLTKLGYQVLKEHGKLRTNPKNRFVPSKCCFSTLFHTLAVVKARVIMESHDYVKNFKPDKIIRSEYYEKHRKQIAGGRICDGEMEVATPRGSFKMGVEVQLANKGEDTLRKYFRRIDEWGFDRCLWVCEDQVIINRLISVIKNEGAYTTSLFTTLNELENKGLQKTPWLSVKGERTTLFKEN
jgi:hypothetical protein